MYMTILHDQHAKIKMHDHALFAVLFGENGFHAGKRPFHELIAHAAFLPARAPFILPFSSSISVLIKLAEGGRQLAEESWQLAGGSWQEAVLSKQ